MRATVIGLVTAVFLAGGGGLAMAGQSAPESATGPAFSQNAAGFPGQSQGAATAPSSTRQPLPGRSGPGPTWGGPSRPSGQAIMIRIEVTLSDQVGAGTPTRKTVSLTARDDNRAIIRTENRSRAGEHGTPGPSLNVEARPTLAADGKIHLELSVLYDLPDAPSEGTGKVEELPWTTRVQEGFGLLLENDKPLVVSQSADPRINRKVTVEVKATVLK